ncbi:hypothetical protein ACFQ0M_49130 [Kitasatospora aburaviensis]
MTTYPPERIIIDVETEGEFLTDDQPTPNTAGGRPTAPPKPRTAPAPASGPASPPAPWASPAVSTPRCAPASPWSGPSAAPG